MQDPLSEPTQPDSILPLLFHRRMLPDGHHQPVVEYEQLPAPVMGLPLNRKINYVLFYLPSFLSTTLPVPSWFKMVKIIEVSDYIK
jgi:hypothetical protein